MEELPSKSIKALLLTPGIFFRREQDWLRFERVLSQAGRWLRIFHEQVGDVQVESLDVSRLEGELTLAIKELDRVTGHHLDLTRWQNAVLALLGRVANRSVPVSGLHNDLSCANVFATPDGRVGVHDPGGHVRGPVYADLAVLINDPSTRMIQVLSGGLAFSRVRLEECRNAILKGYFDTQPYDRDLLTLYSALAVIRKWTQDELALAYTFRPLRSAGRALIPQVRNYFQSELRRRFEPAAMAQN